MKWGALGEEVVEVAEGVEPGCPMLGWGSLGEEVVEVEEGAERRIEEVESAWWLEVGRELRGFADGIGLEGLASGI